MRSTGSERQDVDAGVATRIIAARQQGVSRITQPLSVQRHTRPRDQHPSAVGRGRTVRLHVSVCDDVQARAVTHDARSSERPRGVSCEVTTGGMSVRRRSSHPRSCLRAALWVLVGPSGVGCALLTIVFAVAMLAVLTQLLAVFLRWVG